MLTIFLLQALEVQIGYAQANKVNLLASNINDPTNGRGGSSIVTSDGVLLRRILTDAPASNIVYADLKPPTSATRDFVSSILILINNNNNKY